MAFSLFNKPKTEDKKKVGKWSPDMQKLHVDFFCQLTYMAAIATSGISPRGLFHFAADLPYVSAHYFIRVNVVARAFNHHYSEACRIVGEATKETEIKGFLLRLASTISSGEELTQFLEKEAAVASENYANHYEGSLEVLKTWTDAYLSLVMAAAIIAVMGVVTMIIGNISVMFNLATGLIVVIATIAGVYMINKSAPRDDRTTKSDIRSREQLLMRKLMFTEMPAGLIIILALIVLKAGMGAVLIAMGITLFPIGLIAIREDSKIIKKDNDVAGFLRSLGGMSQAINVTINEAMTRMDPDSMGSLKEDVELLDLRLRTGIQGNLCWERFVGETGSEQISRCVRIFQDAVSIGGEPGRVGKAASNFAVRISLLRTKRKIVDSGFTWLALVMHVVLVVLVSFIYNVFNTFSAMVRDLMPEGSLTATAAGIPSLSIFAADSSQMQMLLIMITAVVLVLTVANALAAYATGGGHIYKLAFYAGITCFSSGVVLIAVPYVVNILFTGMAGG
jgi:flagellar protein FlaJ